MVADGTRFCPQDQAQHASTRLIQEFLRPTPAEVLRLIGTTQPRFGAVPVHPTDSDIFIRLDFPA
jgi:hypothetical protein